ncbi:MAG: hypothetical protein ACHP7K_10040 [Actinomycetales bacterium]
MRIGEGQGDTSTRSCLILGAAGTYLSEISRTAANLLAQAGIPHAVIDIGALTGLWPAPSRDPFNLGVAETTLRGMKATYAAHGIRHFLLTAALPGPDLLPVCRKVFGDGPALTVIRLAAALPVIRERLTARYADDPYHLAYQLHRAEDIALRDGADALPVHDRPAGQVIDTSVCGIQCAAEAVLAALQWTASCPDSDAALATDRTPDLDLAPDPARALDPDQAPDAARTLAAVPSPRG